MKYALILIALLLTLPAALLLAYSVQPRKMQSRAVTPRGSIAARRTKKRAGSASVIFEVPAGVQWTRIRDEWGDPDYVVFGVAKSDGSVVSWSSLGVAVTASIAGRSLPVELATATAYGYSSSAQDPGVVNRSGPGARVRANFAVWNPDP